MTGKLTARTLRGVLVGVSGLGAIFTVFLLAMVLGTDADDTAPVPVGNLDGNHAGGNATEPPVVEEPSGEPLPVQPPEDPPRPTRPEPVTPEPSPPEPVTPDPDSVDPHPDQLEPDPDPVDPEPKKPLLGSVGVVT